MKKDVENAQNKIRFRHGVKNGCQPEKCPKKCSEKNEYETRTAINQSFWSRSWPEQKLFVLDHVTQNECKRRHTQAEKHAKSFSFVYSLAGQTVCKKFFLATLGYKEN